jgi:hypothetical protein
MPSLLLTSSEPEEHLLSVLAHFFEQGRWGLPVEMGVEGRSLTAEDKLFLLMQAEQHLTAVRGLGAPEARMCASGARSLYVICLAVQRSCFARC